MEFIGKIIFIGERRSGISQKTGETWANQNFCAVEISGDHPRHLAFTMFGAERLDEANIRVGAVYTIKYDIDAHPYNDRWIPDIRATSVYPFSLDGQPVQQPTQAPQPQTEGDSQHQQDAWVDPFA